MITQSVHPDISHTDHFEAQYQISDSSTTKSKSAATQCVIQSSCCRYLKLWKSPRPEMSYISKTQDNGSFYRLRVIRGNFYSHPGRDISTTGTLSYLHESIGGHLLLLQTIAESQVFPNCFYCQNGSKKYLLILRCLHSIALKIQEMLACIVVWSYVNFHAITMDRFFLMIAVSPIKSCFEIRSTLANFERSKSPEYFHTIDTARL